MRSKLFVPGSRPELFAKALASDADAISIDLEDSVVEGRKAEARAAAGEFVRSAAVGASDKAVIVRVNAPEGPHFDDDVRAVTWPRVAMINVPKIESPAALRAAAAAVERAADANGVAGRVGLLVTIETPKGLRLAAETAAAHPSVVGLQFGPGDFFAALGAARGDLANLHAALFALRVAAAEAGVFAYDGAFPGVDDAPGFRAEAEMSRRLGYLGKSCVHPRQVVLANEVFRPSDDEIAKARAVVEAARHHQAAGAGAFVVDGAMVDVPYLRHAEALVALARKLGLVSP